MTRQRAGSSDVPSTRLPDAPAGLFLQPRPRAELNCVLPLVRSVTSINLLCFM